VHSAALDPDVNVEFVQSVGSFQWSLHEHSVSFVEEVLLQIPIVDCESACARPQDHTRRRRLAPARAEMLN
jgi:hypothetical protein